MQCMTITLVLGKRLRHIPAHRRPCDGGSGAPDSKGRHYVDGQGLCICVIDFDTHGMLKHGLCW